MSMPSLKSVFLVKEDVYHQHWTSNKKRYNVGMLYDYAKAVAEPEEVPLSALKKGFENTNVDEKKWSPEFVERCESTNMEYPILVVKDRKNQLWIADGNHRYGKAILQGDEMIWAYVVDEKKLPEKAIEPDPSEEDSGSHKAHEDES
jgi:hypothetical protein